MAFKTSLLYFAQVKVVFKITFKNVFKVYVTLKWAIPLQVYAKTLQGCMPRGTNVYAWGAEQEMHQAEERVRGCILQMSCWDGPAHDCNVMRGIQISQTLFFNEPRNFNFQILAVVDCKKWTQVIPLPLSKPLGQADSGLALGSTLANRI